MLIHLQYKSFFSSSTLLSYNINSQMPYMYCNIPDAFNIDGCECGVLPDATGSGEFGLSRALDLLRWGEGLCTSRALILDEPSRHLSGGLHVQSVDQTPQEYTCTPVSPKSSSDRRYWYSEF